jgi:leucyl/phenylalanyl-tRNA--protein transferase
VRDEPDDQTLTPELLLHGYSIGIFPMAEHRDDPEIFWVDPRQRGVLPLDGFHISRSLARRMRRPDVRATVNACFDRVLAACADRSETWINDEIAALYRALHARGDAHSMEIWYGDRLAGGVYGVALGGAFFGESMFSAERDGSKVALACLVAHLGDRGFTLFYTQFVTPHLLSLGAEEIPRAVYHSRLRVALARAVSRIDAGPVRQPQEMVQRITQISY